MNFVGGVDLIFLKRWKQTVILLSSNEMLIALSLLNNSNEGQKCKEQSVLYKQFIKKQLSLSL